MALFESAQAKVERARQQLKALEADFTAFFADKPYEIRQEQDVATGEKLLAYYPSKGIPLRWPVILGEIFYDLRSALDHAMTDLTIRDSGKELAGSEFPIYDDKTVFFEQTKKTGEPTRRSGLYKMRGVLDDKTRRTIIGLQPFSLLKTDTVSILTVLHQLNIVDKHRTLHLCRRMQRETTVVVIRELPLVSWGIGYGLNLDERAELSRWKLSTGLDDKVDMEAHLIIEVGIDEGTTPFLKTESAERIGENLIRGVQRVLLYLENPPADI